VVFGLQARNSVVELVIAKGSEEKWKVSNPNIEIFVRQSHGSSLQFSSC